MITRLIIFGIIFFTYQNVLVYAEHNLGDLLQILQNSVGNYEMTLTHHDDKPESHHEDMAHISPVDNDEDDKKYLRTDCSKYVDCTPRDFDYRRCNGKNCGRNSELRCSGDNCGRNSQLRCSEGNCGRNNELRCSGDNCGRNNELRCSGDNCGRNYELRCSGDNCGRNSQLRCSGENCGRNNDLRCSGDNCGRNNELRCSGDNCGRNSQLRCSGENCGRNNDLRCSGENCGRNNDLRCSGDNCGRNNELRCSGDNCGRNNELRCSGSNCGRHNKLRCSGNNCGRESKHYGRLKVPANDNIEYDIEKYGKKYQVDDNLEALVMKVPSLNKLLTKLNTGSSYREISPQAGVNILTDYSENHNVFERSTDENHLVKMLMNKLNQLAGDLEKKPNNEQVKIKTGSELLKGIKKIQKIQDTNNDRASDEVGAVVFDLTNLKNGNKLAQNIVQLIADGDEYGGENYYKAPDPKKSRSKIKTHDHEINNIYVPKQLLDEAGKTFGHHLKHGKSKQKMTRISQKRQKRQEGADDYVPFHL